MRYDYASNHPPANCGPDVTAKLWQYWCVVNRPVKEIRSKVEAGRGLEINDNGNREQNCRSQKGRRCESRK